MPHLSKEQFTLGQLIDALKKCDPEESVRFDFCNLAPGKLGSYRGFYEDLALEWRNEYPYPKVATLLESLKSAVGDTFHGWKGGEYRMSRKTALWVANSGDTSNTIIVGVEDHYGAVIRTGYLPH